MTTVIKAGQSGPILKRLASVDLADHLVEARQALGHARQEAGAILDAAKENAERLYEKEKRKGHKAGFEVGFAEGRIEGEEKGRQEACHQALQQFQEKQEHLITDIRRAIGDLDAIKRDFRTAVEKDLLDFALQVAIKLTFSVGKTFREAAQENLRRAMRLVADSRSVRILAHPEDMETLQRVSAELWQVGKESDSVKFEADSTLAPGGCIVKSDRTEVDASLETQVESLVQSLLGSGGGHA
ncbi:MAG: FliH/SctL family protein [Planctomycetota bacterium]